MRVWRWSEARTAYRFKFRGGKWTVRPNPTQSGGEGFAKRSAQVSLDKDDKDESSKVESMATFTVPHQPQLFGKVPPPTLYLSTNALLDDEIFLMLVFIYSETRRRDKNVRNSSSMCRSLLGYLNFVLEPR